MQPPPGFERVRTAQATWWLRADIRAAMLALVQALERDWHGLSKRTLCGGRGGAFAAVVGGHEVVVRPYRRGGIPARLLRATYCGWHPRPFRELGYSETLRARGAPVVEVYGAAVRWVLPGCYRGWLVTRYVPGARTLWEWAASGAAATERERVLPAVGAAIRRLHAAGGRHPDLNLNNILVVAGEPAPAVLLIDFDRPRITACRGAAADLARLRRSARKLDPSGTSIRPADLDRVEAAYRS